MKQLIISGLTPFTTIDFPHHLATTLFCQGCTWRCSYCHNPQLLPLATDNHSKSYLWSEIEMFLQSRQHLLDAVVFSGGEPTLQPGLLQGVQQVKQLGFKVGLHTAGINPNNLLKVLPYLDWVSFDIKAPFADYDKITKKKNSGYYAQKSIHFLLNSGVLCEFHTTPYLIDEKGILEIANDLAKLGVKCYITSDLKICT